MLPISLGADVPRIREGRFAPPTLNPPSCTEPESPFQAKMDLINILGESWVNSLPNRKDITTMVQVRTSAGDIELRVDYDHIKNSLFLQTTDSRVCVSEYLSIYLDSQGAPVQLQTKSGSFPFFGKLFKDNGGASLSRIFGEQTREVFERHVYEIRRDKRCREQLRDEITKDEKRKFQSTNAYQGPKGILVNQEAYIVGHVDTPLSAKHLSADHALAVVNADQDQQFLAKLSFMTPRRSLAQSLRSVSLNKSDIYIVGENLVHENYQLILGVLEERGAAGNLKFMDLSKTQFQGITLYQGKLFPDFPYFPSPPSELPKDPFVSQ